MYVGVDMCDQRWCLIVILLLHSLGKRMCWQERRGGFVCLCFTVEEWCKVGGDGGGIQIMVDDVVNDCDGMMVCFFNVEFKAHQHVW